MQTRLFGKSSAFLDAWIRELTPAAAAAVVTTVATTTVSHTGAPHPAVKHHLAPPLKHSVEGDKSSSSMSKVHLQVGRVLSVKKHPESAKLFVEEIDIGEPSGPRTILSGLQEHITEVDFLNRLVIVVSNLEPRKIGGIFSAGMVLCASTSCKGKVELLTVPLDTPIGERVVFPGHDGPAEPVLKKKLAKHFEDVAPDLRTDENGVALFKALPFVTSKGTVTSSINNGHIS